MESGVLKVSSTESRIVYQSLVAEEENTLCKLAGKGKNISEMQYRTILKRNVIAALRQLKIGHCEISWVKQKLLLSSKGKNEEEPEEDFGFLGDPKLSQKYAQLAN